MKLCNATLAALPDAVQVPTYDRTHLTPGIVHIGLGNFHRAHQAWYLHRLMQRGEAMDWAIIGAGVRAGDAAMRDRLLAQDCLTTLIELGPSDTGTEVIGSMVDFVEVADGNAPLIATMSDPRIRIVALTITEGGYFVDAATGGFEADHKDIQHDAANPATPRTAFGAMIAALKARRAAGAGPFTAQSCDNIQGNGEVLRQTLVSLAKLSDPDLAAWIDANVSFPNSMVDCIVPATGETEITLARDAGVDDAAPVTHESFRQWVIEDDFCAGRPDWDHVGATFSEHVHDFEAMKIRILNGGHQVVANVGELLGIETIAGCMEHQDILDYFRKVQTEEIAPYVAPVPAMDPADYVTLIETRFANPAIFDTTRRVSFDGSSRHPGFIHPILRDAIAAGGSIDGLALVEALWARMCHGTRQDGSTIESNDPFWSDLQAAAHAAKEQPSQWLAQSHIYGEIAQDAAFSKAFERWLEMLWRDGVVATLKTYQAS